MEKDKFTEQVLDWHNYGLGSVRITDILFRSNLFGSGGANYLERDIEQKPKSWRALHEKVNNVLTEEHE